MGCAATTADASYTIGQTTGATDGCGTNQVFVQAQTGGAPSYQASSAGVIVSWSYRAGSATPSVRLRVYHATGDPTVWFTRSETAQRTPGAGAGQVHANQLNTFTESPGIRIETDDVLGLTAQGSSSMGCISTSSANDRIRVKNPPDPPVGQNGTGFLGDLPNLRVDVSAVVEADADADGFGDDTQDSCPAESSVHTGPCPDADGDGISDSVDTCPNDSDLPAPRNPRTGCPTDTDGDGVFDPSDADDDNDGVPDDQDAFPLDPAQHLTPATEGSDTINGSALDEIICGLGGSDTLNGLAGNDTLWGDACNDKAKRIFGVQTTDGKDKLNGGDGDDKLYGAGGNDTLNGGSGKDKLYGGGGNDKLNGDAGRDLVDGGTGNDKLTGGKDTNTYRGGAGNDTVNARNSKKETVDCGKGSKDVATVDKADVVKRCETVKRPK
jgi:Ca2+-binding RTX toxin-like protein